MLRVASKKFALGISNSPLVQSICERNAMCDVNKYSVR